MLKSFQTHLDAHRAAFKKSRRLLFKKPMATWLTIMVLGMALLFPTLLWLATDYMAKISHDWNQIGHIDLYLSSKDGLAQHQELLQRVQQTPGVAKARYISADEGLAQMAQQEGLEHLRQYASENPLPAVIEVTPAVDVNNKQQFNHLLLTLEKNAGIDEVRFDKEWVGRWFTALNILTSVVRGLMILLGLAVFFVVGHALWMMVDEGLEDIKVLKAIGANDAYISRPFLYLGLWYGFLGALLSTCFNTALFIFFMPKIQSFIQVYQQSDVGYGLNFFGRSLLLLWLHEA